MHPSATRPSRCCCASGESERSAAVRRMVRAGKLLPDSWAMYDPYHWAPMANTEGIPRTATVTKTQTWKRTHLQGHAIAQRSLRLQSRCPLGFSFTRFAPSLLDTLPTSLTTNAIALKRVPAPFLTHRTRSPSSYHDSLQVAESSSRMHA